MYETRKRRPAPGTRRGLPALVATVLGFCAVGFCALVAAVLFLGPSSDRATVENGVARIGADAGDRSLAAPQNLSSSTSDPKRGASPEPAPGPDARPYIAPRPGWIEGYVFIDNRLAREGEVEVALERWEAARGQDLTQLQGGDWPPEWAFEPVTTGNVNADGRFEFRVPDHAHSLQVRAADPMLAGYAARFEPDESREDLWEGEDLFLSAGGTVTLRYTGPGFDPKAFAGTRIGFDSGFSESTSARVVGTMDASGALELSVLEPGLWFHCIPLVKSSLGEELSLEHTMLMTPGSLGRHLIPQSFGFEVVAGEHREYGVRLVGAERLSGSIVDGANVPVQGALVRLSALERSLAQSWNRYASDETGPDGVFEFVTRPEDVIGVTVDAEGMCPEYLEGDRLARWFQRGEPFTIELQRESLQMQAALRVVFPDGAPALHFPLRVTQRVQTAQGEYRMRLGPSLSSGTDGVVRVSRAASGPLEVVGVGLESRSATMQPHQRGEFSQFSLGQPQRSGGADRWWYADARVDFQPGSPAEVVLAQAVELRCLIVGARAEECQVLHDDVLFGLRAEDGWHRSARLRVDSPNVLVVAMRPGRHGVRVEGPSTTSDPKQVTVGADGCEVEFQLRRTYTVRGELALSTEARARARVPYTLEWVPESGETRSVRVDKTGSFQVSTDVEGRFALVATPRGSRCPALLHVLEVPDLDADEPAPLRLAPEPAPRVRVTSTSEDGLRDVTATLDLEGRGLWIARGSITRTVPRSLTWRGVPPGRYVLRVQRDSQVIYQDWIDAPETGAAEIALESIEAGTVEVTGRLVSGGEPFGGVDVELRGAQGRLNFVRVGADGRFELAVLPSDPVVLGLRFSAESSWRRTRADGQRLADPIPPFSIPLGALQTSRDIGDIEVPGGALGGWIEGVRNWRNLHGSRVTACTVDGNQAAHVGWLDGDRWLIPFLPPGTYDVTLGGAPPHTCRIAAPLRVTLARGEQKIKLVLHAEDS